MERALGESSLWRKAMSALHAAARVPRTSVLVTGESGTGKEVAARLLHTWSDRAEGPFVPVNAACFSPSLLESELFGHEAGAFTGARTAKRGLFELASGGTLFLDEVGELPMELQPKLLRVLEGHPFRRVGGEREIRVDVRLVSATNRDLEVAIEAGQFRRDLYHRLRVVDIVLPPLRARGDDIALLATHVISRLSAELGKHRVSLSLEALEALEAYGWPGNVRELRNVIERGIVLCHDGEIRPRDLPPEVSHRIPGASLKVPPPSLRVEDPEVSLDAVIREHVLRTFHTRQQNLTQTARVLGISRVALRRRLKEYGVKAASASHDDCGDA
jgi:DNA-binding NtrC family response regulator